MDKKKIFISSLVGLLAFQGQVQASTMPINPVALSVKAVVRQLLLDSGLSATSAGMIAAQSKVAQYMATNTARIAAGSVAIARSPTMLAIAGTLIVGTIVYTTLGSKGISINMNGDGTTTTYRPADTSQQQTSKAFNQGDLIIGGMYTTSSYFQNVANLINATQLVLSSQGGYAGNWGGSSYSLSNCVDNGSMIRCDIKNGTTGQVDTFQQVGGYYAAPIGCPANTWLQYISGTGWQCKPLDPLPPDPNQPPTSQPTNQTLDTVGQGLKDDEKKQEIAPAALANLVNSITNQVQQDPSYNGPPIPPANEGTVTKGLNNAGLSNPTIGDITAPTTPSNVSYDPITAPTTGTGTTPVYDPATPVETTPTTTDPNQTIVKPDLGTDPGIGTPGLNLEATPTESQMLSPIFNLLPDIKGITFQENAVSCPFNEPFKLPFYNNKEYSFSFMCDFFVQIGPTLKIISLAVFTIIAALIILTA